MVTVVDHGVLEDAQKHPEKYLGKPKMPHYKKKRSISTITFSNQAARSKKEISCGSLLQTKRSICRIDRKDD